MMGFFDAVQCLVLVFLAVAAIRARDPFHGIVLFMVFGLFMAVAWARLNAPDLALTEAALGSGMVGALFLASLGHLERTPAADVADRNYSRAMAATVAVLLTALAVLVLASPLLVQWQTPTLGLKPAAFEALPRSGVTNPVTAVILNYRAYDTLIELSVLLLALVGVQALRAGLPDPAGPRPPLDPVLGSYARMLTPFLHLVALYLLWAGGHRPGGAFQAGSILAGMGVLLMLAGMTPEPHLRLVIVRAGWIAGVFVFAACGLLALVPGGAFLEWPPAAAKLVILAIEAAGTLSISLCLLGLFAACAAAPRREAAS